MISACIARLLSFSSGVKLQLLISTEFNGHECLTWGGSLNTKLRSDPSLPDIKPILSRLQEEPLFALDDLKHNAIASGIIGYTSAVEYFLKDVISLCLQRNTGLRKKGLSSLQLSALELEQTDDINKIKLRLIRRLSNENSKGSLFSHKFRKSCAFLNVEESFVNKSRLTSLDSIWSLRNEFAHVNQSKISSYTIASLSGEITLFRNSKSEEYLKFIVGLIEIIDVCNEYLKAFDKLILSKWDADIFISED